MRKPTISMRKYDETAFVNIRTHWSLIYSLQDGPTYELQVRHDAVEDQFVFISHDASQRDELELITEAEFKSRVMNIRAHEDMSHEDAETFLADKVAIMNDAEARILEHLRKYWDAFVLLFEPAINL